ncbi:SNF2-related protein [Malacoplasma iowae]|uniref:DEAD/DEAH box helicase n=1 Tax=Malacoplasma iowae 695 TaxID=1048830 RepID=A0A6P1LHT7_MALIO|nr:DEAD/DEAH box helicase [Malacoplasma iowae]QHG89665.1 DEAD/DEAH box helicase [Malacoplasma iowae 695]WPL35546.1 DEAD/DEAH box helicase [Malacoplasma iowae]
MNMTIIKDMYIDSLVNHNKFKDRGIEYYSKNEVSIEHVDNKHNGVYVKFNSKNYTGYFIFENSIIKNFKCSCKTFEEFGGPCKHIIASFYKYNEYLVLRNLIDINKIDDFNLGFSLNFFNHKVYVIPYVVVFHKSYPIILDQFYKGNISIDYNGVFLNLNPLIKDKKEFYNIINFLNQIRIDEPQFRKDNFRIQESGFKPFLKMCADSNCFITDETGNVQIFNEFNDEKNKLFFLNFEDKDLKFKKKNDGLIELKSHIDFSDFSKLDDCCVGLFTNNETAMKYFVFFDLNQEENLDNLYSFFNFGIRKENFVYFFELITKAFSIFKFRIDLDFIQKNNLLNRDPILGVTIENNEDLNNVVVKIHYLYGEQVFNFNDNSSVNGIERKFDLEQKILEKIKKHLGEYIEELNLFVFDNQQQFDNLLKWASKNKDNKNYLIKLSKSLVYKPRVKSKFYVSGIITDVDYLEVKWSLEGFTDSEAMQIINAYLNKQEYIILSSNKKININKIIDFTSLENELDLLNTNVKNITNLSIRTPKWNAYYLNKQFKDDAKFNEFVNKIQNVSSVETNLSETLKGFLKPYQLDGYKWLKKHYYLKTGSILSDEMGLGKTIQTISLFDDIYNSTETKKTSLIVTPSSLIYNWVSEFSKFADHIKIKAVDGNGEERKKIIEEMNKYNVLVTSYNMLSTDLELYKKKNFELIVIDEGHLIKNHFTIYSKSIKSLTSNHKVALTGTPMENNILELWSLFDFVMPGFLGEFSHFKSKYKNTADKKILDNLKDKIYHFILRRTKKDVLKDLPEKNEKTLFVDLNNEQKLYYSLIFNQEKQSIINKVKENKTDFKKNNMAIFALLTKLRQICCSPKLIINGAKNHGSKFDLCISLIDQILKNKEKVLVFSQFSEMLKLMSEELNKRNIKHFVITGQVNKKERQELVDRFNDEKNEDVKVFLITLKSGGVGLNLSTANNVIHYDPWWNLSAENQASDRAHRIGQKNNVNVFKLISKDSIEEKIINLQDTKKALIENILDLKQKNIDSIPISEILDILGIKFSY